MTLFVGRDIRVEVVRKGYLLPLGLEASFVKFTERLLMPTEDNGIEATLRQRLFLRMAEPIKRFAAIGQPHLGPMWPRKVVQLRADKTPEILDPTLIEAPVRGKQAPTGRISLGQGPGLAFWPRTDITPKGLYRFPVAIDGVPTSLPMLFVDNIAATTAISLCAAVDHYNGVVDIINEWAEPADG